MTDPELERNEKMNAFEADMMERARQARADHIASGRPCCFKCRHQRPPNNPEHASHYVACAWIESVLLPQHMNFGNTRALMPYTAGENCKAFAT